MAEQLSNLGYLALVKETTPGVVPSTPNIYTPLFDESIAFDTGLTEDLAAFGSKSKVYNVLPGRRSYTGDITVTAEPNTAAHLFNGLITQGTPSGSGPYTYPFTLSGLILPKTYTIDVAKGRVVHRYMGAQIESVGTLFKENEMQFKVKLSALSSFIVREIASIATTTITLTSTYSDFSATPTTGLVAGDLVSIISATGAVADLLTTVASITGTTVVLGASAAAFTTGDQIVIRAASAPSLATVTPFLWSRSEYRFGATAAAALTATHTPLEAGTEWTVTHSFNDVKGEWRSGSFNPASLARKTGEVGFKFKQFFDSPTNLNALHKNAKNSVVCRHFSESGYELRVTINNFKVKDVVPKFKVGDLFYSEMMAVSQYDTADGQMYGVTVINNLATV